MAIGLLTPIVIYTVFCEVILHMETLSDSNHLLVQQATKRLTLDAWEPKD
ncbi:MAG: hypothetical protein ACI88H_002490 [Cocleimonas sp.]|jgi:hypothetical protein